MTHKIVNGHRPHHSGVTGAPPASSHDKKKAIEEASERQEKEIDFQGKNFANEDERQAAIRLQEQCHLMFAWESFTSNNHNSTDQQSISAAYDNLIVVEDNDPALLINQLMNKGPDADLLFNLNSTQLSMLVPQVRLMKLWTDPSSGKEISVELPLEDFLSKSKLENITKNRSGRGEGAGLKSFSWKTVGKSPANSFQFEANMVLHFQSIEDIFVDRNTVAVGSNKQTESVSFADLLIPQTRFRKGADEGPRVWNPDYFKIKAVVGWKTFAARGGTSIIPKDVLDILSKTHNTFILAMFNHEIDVKEDGSVDLSIRFMTLPESLASEDQKANILFPSVEERTRVAELNKEIAYLENNLPPNQVPLARWTVVSDSEERPTESQIKDLRRLEEARKELFEYDSIKKTNSYKRIIGRLYNDQRLHYTLVDTSFINKKIKLLSKNSLTADDVEELRKLREEANQSQAALVPISSETSQVLDVNEESSLAAGSVDNLESVRFLDGVNIAEGQRPIVYFYFGDLVDVVLEGMFRRRPWDQDTVENKELKVILGPVQFYDYGNLVDHGLRNTDKKVNKSGQEHTYTGKLSSVNLADIPISMQVFTEWFNREIVEPGLETMSFHQFISKAVNDLLVKALKTDCYDYSPPQRAKLTYKTFSAIKNEKRDAILSRKARVQLESLAGTPFITQDLRVTSGNKEMDNYMLVYGSINNPWELTGNYEEDRQKGVYHLFFGNERGLVKRINFKRSDKPYIRAANMANNYNESKGNRKVLREVYNATVEMVGNNLFEVGSQVRLIPSVGGGPNASQSIKSATDLGIGGYFMVLEREDRVEAGVYQTDLNVVWTSPGNGKLDVGDTIDPRTVLKGGKPSDGNKSGDGDKSLIKQMGEVAEESLDNFVYLGPVLAPIASGISKLFGGKK